jgi:DNA-binding winged helix-turn-helix (wHTH) protein
MAEGTVRIYRFGPFVLDVADGSLKHNGAPIPLTPQVFDLLVTLVENAGRLVEKDLLLKKCGSEEIINALGRVPSCALLRTPCHHASKER